MDQLRLNRFLGVKIQIYVDLFDEGDECSNGDEVPVAVAVEGGFASIAVLMW